MGGIAHRRCRRCGRAPAGQRLVDDWCIRCRTLTLVDSFEEHLAGHTRRVTSLAMLVCEELGVEPEIRAAVELGGLLHDIGKLAIPAAILAKAGPLDAAERELMRTHVTEGERLAACLEGLPDGVPAVVRSSHERWDGRGYPDGLYGDRIPVASRIVSCADAFDAMTSSRSYKAALPMDLALDIVREEAGRQFDPEVAHALVSAVASWADELAAEPVTAAFDATLRRLQRAEARASA